MNTSPDLNAVIQYLESLQDSICENISNLDGSAFSEDSWTRAEGGGGRSRVLRNGAVFEQAGVNLSRVHGTELPKAATLQRPELAGCSFEAAGVSLVLHPNNPYVPTTHCNVRFFLAKPDFDTSFSFMRSIGDHFLPAYTPIVERRADLPFTEHERNFQLYRRGRYVEFNLVYDRGTLFGLQSGGRTESILMSLPPQVRWEYNWSPETGSAEADLYDNYLKPRDWLNLDK